MSVTLGLNLIVGPEDEKELERCLESSKGELFDEIIVTLAMPEEKESIRRIAQRYGARTYFFKWIDDFSAARNFSFSKSTTDYILWCFAPDVRVHTSVGLRPISEVKVGDKVLTHRGEFRTVTKVYVRPYVGEIYEIANGYSDRIVRATPNHEFLSCHNYSCKNINFCKPSCNYQYISRGKSPSGCNYGYLNYQLRFNPIQSLNKGDIVCFPRLKQTIYEPLKVLVKDDDDSDVEIEITPNVMLLLGYCIADSFDENGCVHFDINVTEELYQQNILNIVREVFGVDGIVNNNGKKTVRISFNSKRVYDFINYCIDKVTKRLRADFLGLGDTHLSSFLRGFYKRRGLKVNKSIVLNADSYELAEQLQFILTRFGIMSSISENKGIWRVSIRGKSLEILKNIVGDISFEGDIHFNRKYYFDTSFIYHQILEYNKSQYNGKVYNLEVEGDHSYVVEYMTVHNCDADDVIKPSEYKKLLDLKPKLSNWDIILLNYVYCHDENDRPVLVLPRERIVKRCDYLKWYDPIHEYINMDVPLEKIARFDINIDHYRMKAPTVERNLKIMKRVYESGNSSERIKFYYGKELADIGRWDEALKILEEYVNNGKDFRDNLALACTRLATYYLKENKLELAKVYAMKGIRFNSIYAENYVIMGDIFRLEENIESAIEYYKEAMTKELKGGMSQLIDYYNFIPAIKLAIIYYNNGNYVESKKYCDIARSHKPDNAYVIEIEQKIEEKLKNGKDGLLTQELIEKIEKTLGSYVLTIEENTKEYGRIKITKKKELSVVWFVPILDVNNPSIRLRRYNIHNALVEFGVKSNILTNYYNLSLVEIRDKIGDSNVAIFSQYSKKDFEIISYLKTLGIKCIYDHCEALFGYPFENECLGACDLIICCSSKLEELTNKNGFGNTVVIPDAVEKIYDNTIYEDRYKRPKAVYMGMGGNSWLVTEWLKDIIEKAGYDLVVITEWDNATKKWSLESWDKDMLECDVALCPQRVEVQPAKSSVKAVTAMALGLPVVCSPLQAYKEIIRDGENGFICETFDDWYNALIKLKDSKMREKIGKAGKNSIKDYLLPNIVKKYISILTDLINNKINLKVTQKNVENINRPLVDIIIPTYNNVEYLKLCLNSIFLNTSYPYHIIISDAGSNEETWKYLKALKGITIIGECGKRLTYAEACNAGILSSNTKYFVILNSDVIVSKGWLENLVKKMESTDRLASCGVLSNCDRGWLHDAPNKPKYPMKLEKAGVELIPGMKIEQIKPHLEELYEFMAKSNERYKDIFVPQEWVAGYATIYARSAINEVGLFDPLFKNGCEDLDLMIRLNKYGYKTGQAIDSFVFHFGGVSRGAYQNENKEIYDKEDKENHLKLRTKWKNKKIAIWTGPAWEKWNKDTVDSGMAGSETWASYIAREFVKLGYDTYIYNDLLTKDGETTYYDIVYNREKNKEIGRVVYRDYQEFKKDIEYDIIDYLIVSRTVEPLRDNVHSIKNFVMIHDVWLSGDRKYDVLNWKVYKYSCLSEWHRDFVANYHNIPKDKIILTSNGIDMDLYSDVDNYQKKNQTVYSSSPDRGLYQLLKILPEIRKYVPDFELIVAYGFYNWEKAAKFRNDQDSMILIEKIKSMMTQDGVKYVGRVSKSKLAEYQKESKVWLYPTWWAETFCITAVENGVSKNALVSTDLAGLKTTVGNSGILLDPNGLERDKDYPKEYVEQFVEETVKLLKDESYRREWVDKAYSKMKYYSWENVVQEWVKYF